MGHTAHLSEVNQRLLQNTKKKTKKWVELAVPLLQIPVNDIVLQNPCVRTCIKAVTILYSRPRED